MTSAGPSTDHSTLTPKQLEDSVAEAEKEWELKYSKPQRQFDEDREKDPEDYESSVEPFQTQLFTGKERQEKMEVLIRNVRNRMVKENEKKG
ncbi:MAG: hypothetical protein L6R42_009193, partial [Xanthoria sp. 1 TBL-2021]